MREFTQLTLGLSLSLAKVTDVSTNEKANQFENEVLSLKAKFMQIIPKFWISPAATGPEMALTNMFMFTKLP